MTGLRLSLAAALAAALACDGGLEPRLATDCVRGICGHVALVGTPPDSTEAMFIGAYVTFPTDTTQLFTLQPFPPPLLQIDSAAFAEPQHYTLAIPPGTYTWVVVVWKKLGSLSASNLALAGFYRDPADTTQPGTVVVTTSTGVDSIDLVVDFAKMIPVDSLFPAAGVRP